MKRTVSSSIQEPKLKFWSLKNNTLCVVANMPDAPLTCLDFWIKAGSSFENEKEEGIAHFLEHMVFKGGHTFKEGDFDREIEALGGSSNAATGFDDVHFHVLVPSHAVNHALDLLLNLVLRPTLDPDAFEIEREVVLEEIAQHNDLPEEQVFQQLLRMCWGEHPYARSILGSPQSLHASSPKQMRLFHKRLYKGINCVISIAGKIPNNIEKIIDNSFLATINSGKKEQKTQKNTSHLVFKRQREEIKIKRLESTRITMAWPIPPAREQLQIMGADIATSLLCEGRRSRLVEHLREDLQIVESIEMDITSLEEGGLIVLEACCRGNQRDKVEKEIHKILRETIQKPPTDKEIHRARQLVINSLCFSLELSSNVSSIAASQAIWGRPQPLLAPLKHIEYWTGERLQREIFNNVQPNQCTTLIAIPYT